MVTHFVRDAALLEGLLRQVSRMVMVPERDRATQDARWTPAWLYLKWRHEDVELDMFCVDQETEIQ